MQLNLAGLRFKCIIASSNIGLAFNPFISTPHLLCSFQEKIQ